MFTCPFCKKPMIDRPKNYACQCGFFIWKEMSGRILTPREITGLLDQGHTPILAGFKSRTGKPFSAPLILDRENKKVVFDFGKDREFPGPDSSTRMRVESSNSGVVSLKSPSLNAQVAYGLVSSRLAEILGCTTLTRMASDRIDVSVNSHDTARYILREAWPRDKETQAALTYLWSLLEDKTSTTPGTRPGA